MQLPLFLSAQRGSADERSQGEASEDILHTSLFMLISSKSAQMQSVPQRAMTGAYDEAYLCVQSARMRVVVAGSIEAFIRCAKWRAGWDYSGCFQQEAHV